MTMAEYIDREAALKAMEWTWAGKAAFDAVKAVPAADVRPVVRGEDISATHNGHCEFKCSECGAWAGEVAYGTLDGGRFNFCPNCGADMTEKAE